MKLPEKPGAYLDAGGDVWIRTTRGAWIDCFGQAPITNNQETQDFLISNGPYTPMPRGVAFGERYRVRNDGEGFASMEYRLFEEAELGIENPGDYMESRTSIEVPWTKVPTDKEAAEDVEE